jgi:hypothetical protein
MAAAYSVLDVVLAWVFGLWIPFGLGMAAGVLRVYLFWLADESSRFRKHKVAVPQRIRARDFPEEERELQNEYQMYEKQARDNIWWKKPTRLLFVVTVIVVLVYADERLIFSTFFFTMLTVWMWHWVWLSRRVGK